MRMTRRVKLEEEHCRFVDQLAEQHNVSQSIIIQAMIDYYSNNIANDKILEYINIAEK